MNLEDILKRADKIVFDKTGRHLSYLQQAVLRGILKDQTYEEIVKECRYSASYARQVGAELLKMLSEELGETVNKTNLRAAMERLQVSFFSNVVQDRVQVGSISFCEPIRHPPNTTNSHQSNEEKSNPKQPSTPHQDLSEMPELDDFYSRTSELDTLKTWILQERCRLISLIGIGGIGKTALAVQLVRQIKDEFEYVVWCSLKASPTFAEFETKLLQVFSQSTQEDSSAINTKTLPPIKYLQKYRCLIVLDDIHHLFSSGKLAGTYKAECQEYQSFFTQIKELSHESCFLLINREQSIEFANVKSQNTAIRTLPLAGLDMTAGKEILKDYGLIEIENSETLIRRYQGNPFWLESVGYFIEQSEGCTLNYLLSDDTIFLPKNVEDTLQKQYDRLSEQEKQILSILATKNEAIAPAKLLETAQMKIGDLLETLKSLYRRSFIEKQENLYIMPPVLRQYFG